MLNLTEFENRLVYGQIREDLFFSFVKRFNLEYRNQKQTPRYLGITNIADLKDARRGDFTLRIATENFLNENLYECTDLEVDVKSTQNISLKSILNFRGAAFVCLYTKDLNCSYVVNAYSLMCYVRKILQCLNVHPYEGKDGIIYLPRDFNSNDANWTQLDEAREHGIVWLPSGDPGFKVKHAFRNKMYLNNFLVYLINCYEKNVEPMDYNYTSTFKI